MNRSSERTKPLQTFLNLWAYLDNRDLWFELFTPEFPLPIQAESLTWFKSTVENKQDFEKVMRYLLAYSIIEAKQNSAAYSMHADVHDFAFQTTGKENKSEFAWLAVTIVGRAHPTMSGSVVSAIPDRSLACNSRVSAQEGAYPPSRLRAFALPTIN